jgi:hypothetical protein
LSLVKDSKICDAPDAGIMFKLIFRFRDEEMLLFNLLLNELLFLVSVLLHNITD